MVRIDQDGKYPTRKDPEAFLMRFLLTPFCFFLFLLSDVAFAHKPSDSYLHLHQTPAGIDIQWDIAIKDLEYSIGLDADNNGDIQWQELERKKEAIFSYALERLSISSHGKICSFFPPVLLVDHHSDGAYVVLRFQSICEESGSGFEIQYSLFFDLDPTHRGIATFTSPSGTYAKIFTKDMRAQSFHVDGSGYVTQFLTFLGDGIWHIWIGFDHILFLLALLFPSVLKRVESKWASEEQITTVFVGVVKIVTAFTVAHSLTLTLAALQMVALPSRLVESVIAASVVFAALNCLFPLVREKRWILAFVFGLIHGFGFASILLDQELPQNVLLLSLVAFNLGVEIGQLAIVAVFLPVAFSLRSSRFYRVMVLRVGSGAIAVIAVIWFLERALNLILL